MSDSLPLTPFSLELRSLVDKVRLAERLQIVVTLRQALIECKTLRPSMEAEEALNIAINRITPEESIT